MQGIFSQRPDPLFQQPWRWGGVGSGQAGWPSPAGGLPGLRVSATLHLLTSDSGPRPVGGAGLWSPTQQRGQVEGSHLSNSHVL